MRRSSLSPPHGRRRIAGPSRSSHSAPCGKKRPSTSSTRRSAIRDFRLPTIAERIRRWAAQDAADLEPELQRRAEAQKAAAIKQLLAVGEAEAKSLQRLLEDQRARIAKADAEPDDRQLSFLPDVEAEAEQRRRDRRHWKAKLERLTTDIEQEPERVRRSYSVAADRLETIGLVYLWPETN